MTLQERIEKLEQAQALIAEVLDDMDKSNEAGRLYDAAVEAESRLNRAILATKPTAWPQETNNCP